MKFKRVGKKIFLRAIYGQNTKSGLNPFVAYVLVIFSKNYGHVRAFTGKINRYMLNPTVTSVSELHKPFTGKRACFLWGCVIDSIVVLFFFNISFQNGQNKVYINPRNRVRPYSHSASSAGKFFARNARKLHVKNNQATCFLCVTRDFEFHTLEIYGQNKRLKRARKSKFTSK